MRLQKSNRPCRKEEWPWEFKPGIPSTFRWMVVHAGNKWNVNEVTYSSNMFSLDTNLVGGAGTQFDAFHTDKAYAHIDGGTSNPRYLTAK